MRKMFLCATLLLLAGATQAQVLTQEFVPESGFYWNRDQPGRGYAIEIQDRLVFMTIYTYTEQTNAAQREPLWFSVTGSLGATGPGGGVTYRFTDELAFSEDGQCLGCAHLDPITSATGRPVTLTFDSLYTGNLEIDGEQIPIERFWYSASIDDAFLALEGQWILLTDCTAPVNNNCFPSDVNVQPFEGDLLTLDTITGIGTSQTTDGFRSGTNIEVSAAFDEAQNVFVIVVAETGNESLAYVVFGEDFGTDQFRGLAERFTPGSNLTGAGFPAFGRRISDLTFAETLSPAAKQAAPRPAVSRTARTGQATDQAKPGLAAAVSADRLAGINRTVRRLEASIKSRRGD